MHYLGANVYPDYQVTIRLEAPNQIIKAAAQVGHRQEVGIVGEYFGFV